MNVFVWMIGFLAAWLAVIPAATSLTAQDSRVDRHGDALLLSFALLAGDGQVASADVPDERAGAAADVGEYHRLLRKYFQGDASARRQLESGPPEAIAVVEDHWLNVQRRNLPAEELQRLIADLGHEAFRVREAATERLLVVGMPYRKELSAALEATMDPEIAFRLRNLLASLDTPYAKKSRHVPLILRALYQRHLDSVVPRYLERFEEDFQDRRALLLFQYVEPKQLTPWLEKVDRPLRLRCLLALKFAGNRLATSGDLFDEFTAEEVLSAAEKTFWPIEIHVPIQDGAYRWTVRAAKVDGRRAQHVLKLSINERSADGQILHVQTWPQWDYLFEFQTPYLDVYHGIVLMSAHENPDLPGDYLRHDLMLRPPQGLDLPRVEMSQREQQNWRGSSAYDWAKSLYPADTMERVTFRPSPYDPPGKIISP